jgi:hypothetical protein
MLLIVLPPFLFVLCRASRRPQPADDIELGEFLSQASSEPDPGQPSVPTQPDTDSSPDTTDGLRETCGSKQRFCVGPPGGAIVTDMLPGVQEPR